MPFTVALFVFTGILFLTRVLKLLDLVVNKNVSLIEILTLFSYIIPRFLEVSLPMSLLIGVIVGFSRLSAESELIVLRSAGLSLRALAFPVVIFSAGLVLCTLIVTQVLRPEANYRLGLGLFQIAREVTSASIIPGAFTSLGRLTIYAEKGNEDGSELEKVLIADQREGQEKTFIAKQAQILSDEGSRLLTLRLFDGNMLEGHGTTFNVTQFDINNINVDYDTLVEGGPAQKGKKSSELSRRELDATIANLHTNRKQLSKDERKRLWSLLVERHYRYAIPFACLCVALAGLALGVQPSRGGNSWGLTVSVIVGIVLSVSYYILLAIVSALGKEGYQPIGLFVWAPNIIFIALSIYIFRLAESEDWMTISDRFASSLKNFMRFFTQRRAFTDKNALE